jgi:hypothetical protein
MKYSSPQQTGKQLRFAEDENDILIISPVSESACPLPMKKCKVSIDTHKTPWVSGLTAEHKIMLQNNSWLCSEIINACTTIITKQFPAISGFQSTERAPYYREDTQSWSHQFGQFHPQNKPSVQIHHTG